ncbi:hypothetical protein [Allopontixanthobacter sediminis]|uniref:Uncharacterized protein n=1 Tax=Allopontixanthobacter sediminis TaxID=1689985 RepID=A0A845AZ93_9SPHN|nr:hypothetical protein [Allopontixanthobacter sediminis]
MRILLVGTILIALDELLDPPRCSGARRSAIAEIQYEARIMRGQAAKFGCGHIGLA